MTSRVVQLEEEILVMSSSDIRLSASTAKMRGGTDRNCKKRGRNASLVSPGIIFS